MPPYTKQEINELSDLPEGWIWVKSDKLFPFVTSGSRGWAKYYSDKGALFLRITNLDFNSLYLDLEEEKKQYVDLPGKLEGHRTLVKEGDFLFSITGYLGMFAICPELEEAYVNQHIALVRPFTGFNKKFLGYWIISESGGRHYLSKYDRGATKSGLRLDDIRNFPIPICSVHEQELIVEEIESRLSVVEQLEKTIEENLQKAKALRQSILKKVFRGELVAEGIQEKKTDEIEEVTPFQQIQMIGVLVDILKEEYDLAFGEMALAKFLFLIDRIKKYQTGFRFKDWHWGPYDPDIKKRLTSKNGFFKRGKMSVIELNEKKKQLLKYQLPDQEKFEEGVNEVSGIIKKFQGKKRVGRQLELLATVCKVIENEGSAEFSDVIKGMKNWKVEKRTFKTKAEMFTEEEIQRCIEFVIKNSWEDKLIHQN